MLIVTTTINPMKDLNPMKKKISSIFNAIQEFKVMFKEIKTIYRKKLINQANSEN